MYCCLAREPGFQISLEALETDLIKRHNVAYVGATDGVTKRKQFTVQGGKAVSPREYLDTPNDHILKT